MIILFRSLLLLFLVIGSLEAKMSSDHLERLAEKETLKKKPVTLKASFIEYIDTQQEKIPCYHFFAKNAACDKKYTLVFIDMNGQAIEWDCKVNEQGQIYYPEGEPFIHALAGYMKGEWGKAFLLNTAQTECAKTVITPFPCTYEQDGYKAELAIVDSRASQVIILAEGFEPHEELVFVIKKEGRVNPSSAKANEKGKVLITFELADEENKSEGEVEGGDVFILLKGSKGEMTIPHVWGKKYQKSPLPGVVLKNEDKTLALKGDSTMSQPVPVYLYKILSVENWENSQNGDRLVLSSEDDAFIHLAMEDQKGKIAQKYWAKVPEYIVLKILVSELPGKLVFETNPGGVTKYYHLYEGYIPLKAVESHQVMKNR